MADSSYILKSESVMLMFQYSQESILADSCHIELCTLILPRFSTRKSRFWPIQFFSLLDSGYQEVSVLARVDFGRFDEDPPPFPPEVEVSVLARVDFGRFAVAFGRIHPRLAFQYSQESILADSFGRISD